MTEYWIWLNGVLGAGNKRAVGILERFGNPEAICRLSRSEREHSGLFTAKELARMERLQAEDARDIVRFCKKQGIRLIPYGAPGYPVCLSVLDNPPLLLYVKGTMPDFDQVPAICVVGPRGVSEYGKKAAFSLGYRLARSGMTVVSGGALGSDTYTHRGALKAGGVTVAVLGCGIENGYLPENEPLRRRIAETGCLISEYPPKAPASRFTFPVRNRILSALSVGTVVIEAGSKSGALITAGYAAEQGRDVFVIPGNPQAAQYAGSNALLRDGARPLLDAGDIFQEYIARFPDKIDIKRAYEKAPVTAREKVHKKLSEETLSKEAKIVYNHIGTQPFYPDELAETGLSGDAILTALTELEIEQKIKAMPGGRYVTVS